MAAVEEMIFDELEPGMRLPSEGDLAESLGVSRLTVREALKVLAARGLVELSKGRRPTVREPDSAVLSLHFRSAIRRDPRALLEFADVREALEVQSVLLASRQASRSGLKNLESALQGMEDAAARWGEPGAEADFGAHDLAFHEGLALAGGNRMLTYLLEGLQDSLRQSFERSVKGHALRGRSVETVLQAHRAVLACVRRADGEGAAEAMRACLRESRNDLRAALQHGS